MDANAKLMAQRMRDAGVNWRPPVKAHRCPQLARSLIEHGANGVLVLTLDEAQLFADWGFTDIHLANQVCRHHVSSVSSAPHLADLWLRIVCAQCHLTAGTGIRCKKN